MPPQPATFDASIPHDPDAPADDGTDTIAAIATPPGQGGVGIVRLSGPRAFAIGRTLFRPGRAPRAGESLVGGTPPSHRLTYGHMMDPATGEVVDEVLAAFMRAPHTYTREDVVELDAHGGPLLLRRILALALAAGARAARPGEMTLRAFLNGRIDLAQAEAVMALVQAESEAGLRLAQRQLAGALSARVNAARAPAMEALVRIEAGIDFPEEDVPPPDRAELAALIEQARAAVAALLAGADRGRLLHEGLRVVILGRPNVGKSSLLNALVGSDRAIVTPIAGTTRDTVEATATIGGVAVHLVDTAGLTASEDPVERIGVERALAAALAADLALCVLDASLPLTPADSAMAANLRALGFAPPHDGARPAADDAASADDAAPTQENSPDGMARPLLLVLNKADLPPALGADVARALGPGAPIVHTSTITPGGVADLEAAIAALALNGQAQGADPLVASVRHRDALRRTAAGLATAVEALTGSVPLDFAALDLRGALDALGEITGETATADLLDRIFAEFCIGK
jgi:tRNA modification GTPase